MLTQMRQLMVTSISKPLGILRPLSLIHIIDASRVASLPSAAGRCISSIVHLDNHDYWWQYIIARGSLCYLWCSRRGGVRDEGFTPKKWTLGHHCKSMTRLELVKKPCGYQERWWLWRDGNMRVLEIWLRTSDNQLFTKIPPKCYSCFTWVASVEKAQVKVRTQLWSFASTWRIFNWALQISTCSVVKRALHNRKHFPSWHEWQSCRVQHLWLMWSRWGSWQETLR